jgi:hypothetical protein
MQGAAPYLFLIINSKLQFKAKKGLTGLKPISPRVWILKNGVA